MDNEVRIGENVAFIEIVSKKYGVFEVIVDIDDLSKIKKYFKRLFVNKLTNNKFYVCGYKNRYDKMVSLHRFVMNCSDDRVVDHVNHNPLDNRKINLKLVNKSENGQNRSGTSPRNKSGYRNVSWHKAYKKWVVVITVNKKQKHIGYYENLKEAAEHAELARKKYYKYLEDLPNSNTYPIG